MKTIRYFQISTLLLLTLFAIGGLVFMSGCKPDEPTPLEATRKKLMAGVWSVSDVKVDNVDQTPLFAGMTLQFPTATEYTSTNGDPVWPASGTWSFTNSKAKLITRDDAIEVAIVTITKNELVLSLTWTKNTYGGGRKKSIAGDHVFRFTK